jgi:hypothetical protein
LIFWQPSPIQITTFSQPPFAPSLAMTSLAQITNVLHDATRRPRKWAIILVVCGHDDKWVCPTRRVIMHLMEGEAITFYVVQVTSSSRIAHVSELALFLMDAEVGTAESSTKFRLPWQSLDKRLGVEWISLTQRQTR